jgi:hypothetical protein
MTYDPKTELFTSVDEHATHAHIRTRVPPYGPDDKVVEVIITFPKSAVIYCNTEARHLWKLFDVPCRCGGYGADLKTFSLAEELRKERAEGEHRTQAYQLWRDQFIADVEQNGPTFSEMLRAYPNVPFLKERAP